MLITDAVIRVIAAGLVATAVLDLWQRLVWFVFAVPQTNWALVGRWFAYLAQGTWRHRRIGDSAAVPHEAMIGWIAHYGVGVAYAAGYFAATSVLDIGPSLASALAFGAVTVAVPWFVMQPGMGLGVMAGNTPRPGVARVHSLSSHLAFGFGLYGSFLAI